jgi:hypothetical protein
MDKSLDKAWRSTCKVVLGDDIGELKLYADWLKEPMAPLSRKRSYLSGKEVNCAVQDYPTDARFVSLDETGFAAKAEPLSINDIKDMDSIIEALQERFAYCGNVVLGNSMDVEGSSDVQDSFHVLGSNFIYGCENIAYSSFCRGSKYLFCTVSDFSSSFLIRTFETHKQSRCFEAWNCYDSSDCYFSSFVENSQEAMFSFSLRNKRHVIGNIELPKDKYAALKAKLLSEIREELVRERRLPSLMEIAASSARPEPVPGMETLGTRNRNEDECDMAPIEEAFKKTSSLLFGRPLHDFRSYERWLMRHIPAIDKATSAVSGRIVYMGRNKPFDLFLKDRLVTEGEIWDVGSRTRLEPSEIESFERLKSSIGRIAYFSPEGHLGECRNTRMVPLLNTSQNCYHCPIASFNEYAAYSYWPRNSKYMFGSALAFTSSFCVDSYYSANLSRTFEVDGCNSCSDLYFSHNCENVRDSMFCFNMKNLTNAIGNSPMDAGRYKALKSSLLAQIADELEKSKELKWDIFNIGSKGSKKLWRSKLIP